MNRQDLAVFLKRYGLPVPPELETAGALRILIVDDDGADRERMARLVRSRYPAAVIEETEDGFVAGHKVAGDRTDLVILDVMLPGVNGLKVCESIRSDARLRGVKVLGMSGFTAGNGLKRRFLESGGDDFLCKDAEDEEFLQKIQTLLGQRAGG